MTPPAHDGQASDAVIDALAAYFRVPRSKVQIVRGHTARRKVIEIERERLAGDGDGHILGAMPIERRNLTALGRKRRREFDRSMQKLRDLGMPDWAVEYYRRASRIVGLPPHMVVCHLAVVAAGRQMQVHRALDHEAEAPDADDEAPAEGSINAISQVLPSYESVRNLHHRVTGLWNEIQRQGALLDAGAEPGGAQEDAGDPDLGARRSTPGTVTPLRVRAPASRASGTRSRRR